MPHEKIAPINEYQIAARTGAAFTVKKGQTIRVIDVEGEQVDDSDVRPSGLRHIRQMERIISVDETKKYFYRGALGKHRRLLPGG